MEVAASEDPRERIKQRRSRSPRGRRAAGTQRETYSTSTLAHCADDDQVEVLQVEVDQVEVLHVEVLQVEVDQVEVVPLT
jgi:hypothetical protein